MLYVVTATLNGLQYTEALIATLQQSVGQIPFRVIVIDNGSTDGTVKHLAQAWAGGPVSVMRNEWNTGVSAAWNMGIRIALANKAEAILVCGNDTAPMPGTVERLYGLVAAGVPFVTGTAVAYSTPEVKVPPVADPSDPLVAAPDFSFFMFNSTVLGIVGNSDVTEEIRQRRAAGSNVVVPVVMNPHEWGLFDSRYMPAFFEDNDYHHRMKLAGVLAVRDPKALFRHECSMTLRANPEVAKLNETTFAKNAELFKAKWGGYPHEVGLQQARPLNCSDAQWAQMSAGHPVTEVSREHVVKSAQAVYQRYGIGAQ